MYVIINVVPLIEVIVPCSVHALDYRTYQKQTTFVGDSVVLPCFTSLSASVDWWYMRTMSSSPSYVYGNYEVYDEYSGRFTVDVLAPNNRNYSLTLHDAQLNDTGFYACNEDGSLGDKHVIELNVSG